MFLCNKTLTLFVIYLNLNKHSYFCAVLMCLHIFSEGFDDSDLERKDSTEEIGGNKGDF